MRNLLIITCLLFIATGHASAQEFAGPLRYNPQVHKKASHNDPLARITPDTLTLPFFEDFSQYSIYPDSNRWADYQVYVNNTMGVRQPSRGVATFDDLDWNGIPYDSFNNANFRYADSLTSLPINLSTDTVGDSLYLSFYYQPQGNGFYPLAQDSLQLFFKTRYGGYSKVWSTPGGSTVQPFQLVMIPITDSLYFHDAFQFRFVNIAALYWADAVWNIDYIKLDKNRSMADTGIGDVAMTSNPTFLLNDYTFMPYNQYKAFPLGETVTVVTDSVRNDTANSTTTSCFFILKDLNNGTSLFTTGSIPISLNGYQTLAIQEPISIPTLPNHPANTKVTFETKFFIDATTSTGPAVNDTIAKKQVFDNYLAYDDGTAEKSYYLNLFPTLPGTVALEFHLNVPDTMRGLAVYFGRQIPFASSKTFSIKVYSSLAGVNGAPSDVTLYTSDLLTPLYADTTDHFWYYTFETPLLLPAGTFYAGTQQCADCGSDSLYLGLDVNRVGSNHAYYNVVGSWNPSLISGAIMIRPLLGKFIHGTGVDNLPAKQNAWQATPNPAKDKLQFTFESREQATYLITDMLGHSLMNGAVANGQAIDIATLPPGMYLITLNADNIEAAPQKLIKL